MFLIKFSEDSFHLWESEKSSSYFVSRDLIDENCWGKKIQLKVKEDLESINEKPIENASIIALGLNEINEYNEYIQFDMMR